MLTFISAIMLAAASAPVSPAVEQCAVMASHPDDPNRITFGKEREDIDLPAAIAVCSEAANERPFDARTAYHLGRVLFYDDKAQEAMPWLEASAAAGYPQSIFVLGYLLSLGDAPADDLCRASEMWIRAVSLGHPWSAYHLVEKSLDGRLARCTTPPTAPELARYIKLARSEISVAASDGRVEALAARLAAASARQGAGSDGITQCDRLIAHPDDPDRVGEGVSRTNADLPAAIEACQQAVAGDPDNPRLNYQLARALGYSGRGGEALPYRAKAVAGDYPQALFVVGYITMLGLNEQPRDVCEGGRLIQRSAAAGRLAGLVGFPHYWQQGRFEDCGLSVAPGELASYLEQAKEQAGGDYYKDLLIEQLTGSLSDS